MKQISDFTTRFSEMLRNLNITQQNVCERVGLNKAIVSRYIYGKAQPKAETLNRIAKTYHVNPIWLMGYDVDMIPIEMRDNSYYLNKLNIVNENLNEQQRKQLIDVAIALFPEINTFI